MWICERCGHGVEDEVKTCPYCYRKEGSGRPVGTSRSTARQAGPAREAFLLLTPGFAQALFVAGVVISVVLGVAFLTRSDPPRVWLGIGVMALGSIACKIAYDFTYMICRIYEKIVRDQAAKS